MDLDFSCLCVSNLRLCNSVVAILFLFSRAFRFEENNSVAPRIFVLFPFSLLFVRGIYSSSPFHVGWLDIIRNTTTGASRWSEWRDWKAKREFSLEWIKRREFFLFSFSFSFSFLSASAPLLFGAGENWFLYPPPSPVQPCCRFAIRKTRHPALLTISRNQIPCYPSTWVSLQNKNKNKKGGCWTALRVLCQSQREDFHLQFAIPWAIPKCHLALTILVDQEPLNMEVVVYVETENSFRFLSFFLLFLLLRFKSDYHGFAKDLEISLF